MIERCPACAKPLPPDAASSAAFPFCSPRCRLRDLGAWLDGRHVIPGRPLADSGEDDDIDHPP